MPELPEVEVTRLGLAPHIEGARVLAVHIHQPRLRWPVIAELPQILSQQKIQSIQRRGKYLLFNFDPGTLIAHLGMSGSLGLFPLASTLRKHDHLEIFFKNQVLRLHDPRRFGAMVWHPKQAGPVEQHSLLRKLGIEPFDARFNGQCLFDAAQARSVSIKQLLLGGQAVVGVGNIYASESLFHAGIHPQRGVQRISLLRYQKLATAIQEILAAAIAAGGSSLRDYKGADNQPGYFQTATQVYDRAGLPCKVCQHPIKVIRQGQRSTFYCANCQK